MDKLDPVVKIAAKLMGFQLEDSWAVPGQILVIRVGYSIPNWKRVPATREAILEAMTKWAS